MKKSDRTPADASQYAFRRVPAWSKFWRPPPIGKVNVIAFANKEPDDEELSINLTTQDKDSSISEIETTWAKAFSEGFGAALAGVKEIREELANANLIGPEVLKDPNPNNPTHGLIVGKPTDAKAEALIRVFDLYRPPDAEKYFASQKNRRATKDK